MQKDKKYRINKLDKMRCVKVMLFSFLILVWVCAMEIKVSAANENTEVVSFATTQVKVGESIEVTVTGCTGEEVYVWMVDGNIIENSGNSYVPMANDYNSWITVNVYDVSENLIGSDTLYFSNLPVVYINTDDGEGITDKSTYKSADMYIQGNSNYESQYNGRIEIKGRGNTSWSYPQKPYKIKLNKSTDLFGFGKNKHWVLLSNYLDQGMLRNVTASQISTKLGLTTMEMTWVDVCMNGDYIGCYELCEHVRIDSTRVNIFDWEDEAEEVAKKIYKGHSDTLTEEDQDAIEEQLCTDMNWITIGKFTYNSVEYNVSDYYTVNDDISGGYLFELSEEYDEVSKFTTEKGMKVMIKSPEYLATNEIMMEYAKGYWKDFEEALCSVDGYNSKGEHYSELAEFDSMVKYWLIMEIMGNNDAAVKSRYAYKDCGEKMVFGPAWDFDWGAGCIAVLNEGAQGWKCSYGTLWKDFTDDPYFFMKAGEEYWKIRDYLEQIIKDYGMLDYEFNYIKESGFATEVEYPDKTCGEYERLGFEGDAVVFKEYMRQRIQWMDEQFLTADNIVVSLYNEEGSNPYTRSTDKLIMKLENTEQDTVSKNLIADGVISENTDVVMKVTVNDADTESVNVYVNGKSFTSINVNEEGLVACTIDSAALTAEMGSMNVISIVGKNAQGNTTYTNFATVLVSGMEKEETQTYTVTYESNGGSEVVGATYPYDTKVEKPENPVRVNYIFEGWYTDKELLNEYDFDSKPNTDITLYAAWKAVDYTISFETNGGSSVEPISGNYGNAIAAPEAPVKEGYDFVGWYSDEALTQKYEFTTIPSQNMTLYASWKRKVYEVKWIDYDGTVLKTESVEHGCNGTEPEAPKREGYTFIGWSASCENVKSNMEIKALYESINVTVTINGTYNKPVKNKSAKKVRKNGVTSITLYTKKYKTAKLTAKVAGVDQPVNWTSSKTSVAKVSKDGKVTARKAGTAYITAEVNGISAQCKIVVKKAKITVKMGKKTVGNKTLKLKVGKKYTLKTTVVPEGKITYKVKNKKILKVSSKGKITTLKKGTTTITISANGMKKKIKVKVK